MEQSGREHFDTAIWTARRQCVILIAPLLYGGCLCGRFLCAYKKYLWLRWDPNIASDCLNIFLGDREPLSRGDIIASCWIIHMSLWGTLKIKLFHLLLSEKLICNSFFVVHIRNNIRKIISIRQKLYHCLGTVTLRIISVREMHAGDGLMYNNIKTSSTALWLMW